MAQKVLPTLEQIQWADCELGTLIHFDLSNFVPGDYDFRQHWGDPLPLSVFQPDKLDVEQWVTSACAMGAKYVVLVAKHCIGFCLWDTKEHDYNVMHTAYGKDIVREFFDACKKHGVKPGLYYSASCNMYMDVDNPGTVKSGDPEKQKAYNQMVLNQLTELWTNYGDVFEIWFDGGCLPPEKGGPDITSLLHKLQPNAVVFQGPAGTKSLLRWVGNERGIADENCSAITWFMQEDADGTVEMRNAGDPYGDTWAPAESDLPNRDARYAKGGGWGWGENEESSVKSGEELFDVYCKSVGRGSNMLVGMCIDKHGRFPEPDLAQFRRFTQLREAAFGRELACAAYEEGKPCKLSLPEGAKYAVLAEDISKGENVLGYTLTGDNGFTYSGKIISHKRIIPLAEGIRELTFAVTEKRDDVFVTVKVY